VLDVVITVTDRQTDRHRRTTDQPSHGGRADGGSVGQWVKGSWVMGQIGQQI